MLKSGPLKMTGWLVTWQKLLSVPVCLLLQQFPDIRTSVELASASVKEHAHGMSGSGSEGFSQQTWLHAFMRQGEGIVLLLVAGLPELTLKS